VTSKVLSKVIDNTICSGYLKHICSFKTLKHLIFLQTLNAWSQDQCQICLFSQLEKKTTKSNLDMSIKGLKSLFHTSAKLKPTVTVDILQFIIIKQTKKNILTDLFPFLQRDKRSTLTSTVRRCWFQRLCDSLSCTITPNNTTRVCITKRHAKNDPFLQIIWPSVYSLEEHSLH